MFARLPASVLRLVAAFAAVEYDVHLHLAGELGERVVTSNIVLGRPSPRRKPCSRRVGTVVVVDGVAFVATAVYGDHHVVDLRCGPAAPFRFLACDGPSVSRATSSVLCSSFCVVPDGTSPPCGPRGSFVLLCRSADMDGHRLRWLRVSRGTGGDECGAASAGELRLLREVLVPADDAWPLCRCRMSVFGGGGSPGRSASEWGALRPAANVSETVYLSTTMGNMTTTLAACSRSGAVLASWVEQAAPLGSDIMDTFHIAAGPLLLRAGPEGLSIIHDCRGLVPPSVEPLLRVRAREAWWLAAGDVPESVRLVLPCDGEAVVVRVSWAVVTGGRHRLRGSSKNQPLRGLAGPHFASPVAAPSAPCALQEIERFVLPAGVRVGLMRCVQEGSHTSRLLLEDPEKGCLLVDLDAPPSRRCRFLRRSGLASMSQVAPDPGVALVVRQVMRQQEDRVAQLTRRPLKA
jgi:hypothetical protein